MHKAVDHDLPDDDPNGKVVGVALWKIYPKVKISYHDSTGLRILTLTRSVREQRSRPQRRKTTKGALRIATRHYWSHSTK